MVSYLVLSLVSFLAVKKYLHKNSFVDYRDILNTDIAPSVSLLAPAYNETETIIENIRSLLSIHYSNFEVIVINDGSKDDTLEKCIEEYELEKVDFAVNYEIETKEIRGIYKSKNRAFNQLIFIDKENGGKSDALNVGINVSSYDYITCIDVDCVLEQDALLKLMKPFMDENEKEVVATGGVIRIANSCVIEDGQLLEVKVPKNFVARSQALEYIRAFLLGRMAWSLMDGLILISGALGVFQKKTAIAVGGYDTKTVGEDMELVVRMRRYMLEKKKKYTVAFIPDPLCWTECPESWTMLGRQRNRWTRGTIETLWKHRGMFFNPKYKLLGMLSYPYWFVFEWLAPILEGGGLMLFFLLALVGLVNWSFFMLMMLLVFGFTITFSVLSLLIEEITYHNYKRKRDILMLLRIGLLEPFLYHPFIVYSAILGNLDYLFGKSSWGEMTRKGFSGEGAKRIRVVSEVKNVSKVPKVKASLTTWAAVAVAVLGVLLYVVVDQDALLTKNELAFNPKLVNLFTPNEAPAKKVIKKEREIMARTMNKMFKPIAIESNDSATGIEAVRERSQTGAILVGHADLIDESDEGKEAKEKAKPVAEKKEPSASAEATGDTRSASAKAAGDTRKKEPKPKKTNVAKKVKYSMPETKTKPTDYYIIGGSYDRYEPALEYRDKLLESGFGRAVLIRTGGKYRVAFAVFDDKDRAKDYLMNIRLNVHAYAWIYNSKN
ncbi:MAG: hypothetical protein CL840_11440 [Crocinitomicaceae bacterium]|nr:hypothetical protein [Crocinitomicaceae bacterium]